MRHSLHDLYSSERTGPTSVTMKPLPGVDGNAVMDATGKLSVPQRLVSSGSDLTDRPFPLELTIPATANWLLRIWRSLLVARLLSLQARRQLFWLINRSSLRRVHPYSSFPNLSSLSFICDNALASA